MPSQSLQNWLTGRKQALDEIESAHRRVCENLADYFDEVMRSHIESITGVSPW
jgi:hypothetical protein